MNINESYTTYTSIREIIKDDAHITYEFEVDNTLYKLICINEFNENWILKFDAIINYQDKNELPAILMTSPSVVLSTLLKCLKNFTTNYIQKISTFSFQTKNDNVSQCFQLIQEYINKYIQSFKFISYLRLGFSHKFLYIKNSNNIYKI